MTASVAALHAGPDRHATPAAPQPMRRWRVAGVRGALTIVVGHLVEVVTQREHWPFSPYQMWSIPSTSWDLPHYDCAA